MMLALAGLLSLSLAPEGGEESADSRPEDEARIFLEMFEAGFKRFRVGMAEEYWTFYTRGDPGRTSLYEKIQSEILGDARTFRRLQAWRGRIADPLLARRAELLYRTFALAQVTAQERIYTLQNSLQKIQINFRSRLRGRDTTLNQLLNVQRFERDRDLRKEAWVARNQVGKEVAPGLSELIRRRDDEANKLGYPGFYPMSLQLSDIDEEWLFSTLGELDRLTLSPYRRWREALRERLGVREVESWDLLYDHDSLLESLRAHFPRERIQPLLNRTFREIGLDPERMPIRVDDEERSGKSQHAFSFSIDVPDDIRILANTDDGISSCRTMFHEMGHSVYSAGIRQPSFLLQEAASACFTEGIAQFFPMLLDEEKWLTEIAGVPADLAREYRRRAREEAPYGIRFQLAVLNFEREAYRRPEQSLTELWWSLAERYLEIPRHPEVDSWAAIIHFTSHPAYYQNYLLADMIAAQLMRRLKIDQGGVLGNPATGAFLQSRVFARGASLPWARLLSETTGEPLNLRYYLEEKLGPAEAPPPEEARTHR
jgi:peptidyl-dipeptidase A